MGGPTVQKKALSDNSAFGVVVAWIASRFVAHSHHKVAGGDLRPT
jgi:hypothetical protein